jgi:protein-S-isoprenylcysteine O-methyltransferase Ste14
MTRRILAFAYGVASYAIFFGTFLYAIGFVGNVLVPTSLDGPRTGSLAAAIAIDLALLTVFAVQHSVMARPAFKRMWTRIVPTEIERSTYVLFSGLALMLMFWPWRPLAGRSGTSRARPVARCCAR